MMAHGSKIPALMVPTVRERLRGMDYNTACVLFTQMKDPIIALVFSILLGGYGIDRMYIGDVGLGVLKLLTCGGLGIWWLADLFLIMDRTREKNMEMLMH